MKKYLPPFLNVYPWFVFQLPTHLLDEDFSSFKLHGDRSLDRFMRQLRKPQLRVCCCKPTVTTATSCLKVQEKSHDRLLFEYVLVKLIIYTCKTAAPIAPHRIFKLERSSCFSVEASSFLNWSLCLQKTLARKDAYVQTNSCRQP